MNGIMSWNEQGRSIGQARWSAAIYTSSLSFTDLNNWGSFNRQLLMSPLSDLKGMHNMYQNVFFARLAPICRPWTQWFVKRSARQASMTQYDILPLIYLQKHTQYHAIIWYCLICKACKIQMCKWMCIITTRLEVPPSDAQRFIIGPSCRSV